MAADGTNTASPHWRRSLRGRGISPFTWSALHYWARILSAGRGTRDISGSLVFLANRSLENHYPGVDALTNYGTYDIDFTAFGFDPRDGGRVPTVVVGSAAEDSVEIVLSPDQGGISVRMRGGISRDSISGKWEVTFPRAGTGGGSFFMTPRGTRKF